MHGFHTTIHRVNNSDVALFFTGHTEDVPAKTDVDIYTIQKQPLSPPTLKRI